MSWSILLIMDGLQGGLRRADTLAIPVLLFGPPVALLLFGAAWPGHSMASRWSSGRPTTIADGTDGERPRSRLSGSDPQALVESRDATDPRVGMSPPLFYISAYEI